MQDHPWIKSYPEGLRWDVELPVRPVQDIIDASAAQWPTLNAIAPAVLAAVSCSSITPS